MIAAANVNQTQPTEAQKQKQKASIAKKGGGLTKILTVKFYHCG